MATPYKPKITSVKVTPTAIEGGQSVVVEVYVDQPGAAHPVLSSSNNTVLQIPNKSIPMINKRVLKQQFRTSPVSGSTKTVTISAAFNGSSKSTVLKVVPAGSWNAYRGNRTSKKTYVVRGQSVGDLYQLAKLKGFEFKMEGGGRGCFVRKNTSMLSVALTGGRSDRVACRLHMFEGNKKLREGWEVLSTGLKFSLTSGYPFTFQIAKPPRGPRDPTIIVEFGVKMNGASDVHLTELHLSGPAGSEWRDAF